MLPLRDDIPSRTPPILTTALILLNSLVFLFELSLGPEIEKLVFTYGVIPARYSVPEIAQFFSPLEQIVPFFTSMFLHGGWMHLIGNMWTLWIFGDNVEDRLGRRKFLILYLLGGVLSMFVHMQSNVTSPVPAIGASGAIAAVFGAYFAMYPHGRVLTMVPPFILGPYISMPAVIFLGWWFVLQFFNGTLSLMRRADEAGGIAWWAHIGGFAFGALLCVGERARERRRLETRPAD